MAVYNEIQTGRVNRFLQKLLGIKGGPPAPGLAGDVMTVLPLFIGAESLIHQGWESFGAAESTAAVAANFSKVAFTNPANSNVIAVITKLEMLASGTFNGQLRYQTPAVANFAGLFASDNGFDNRGRRRSTVNVSSQNSDAVFITGTIVAQTVLGANVLWQLVRDGEQLVVPPNTTLEWAGNAVNRDIVWSVWWRERFLEETERT